MRRVRRRRAAVAVMSALVALGVAGAALAQLPPLPIPEGPDASQVPSFIGGPASPQPLRSFRVPRNPFLAPNGKSNIHNDAYMSDAYRWEGPLGRNTQVKSTYQNAECASLGFDKAWRIVTICVGVEGPRLVLLRPHTLETLATFPLPPRSGSGTGTTPFNDFSGGGYFYLDHRYRAIIPTNNRQIWVVKEVQTNTPAGREFRLVRRYDLSSRVRVDEAIVSALPDWKGRIWFVTTKGLVGKVNRRTGRVRAIRLEDEVIANSFAVGKRGVYIVSDHAMYRFGRTRRGRPRVVWRRRYDRGTRQKPGQVTQGSGTTPTLIGRRFVAITDNADPRMHVLVYRRAKNVDRRLVCKEPVFARNRSATDNSLIAVGRSLIVENNYGYSGPMATEDGGVTAPGITRVKFRRAGGCHKVWTSMERAPSVVPKVSLATGLVYTYTKPRQPNDEDAWYFTAIDFRTGRTVYKRLTGTDLGYNNNWAPISLRRDGTAYVGVMGGLVRLRDTN